MTHSAETVTYERNKFPSSSSGSSRAAHLIVWLPSQGPEWPLQFMTFASQWEEDGHPHAGKQCPSLLQSGGSIASAHSLPAI